MLFYNNKLCLNQIRVPDEDYSRNGYLMRITPEMVRVH